VLVLILEGMAVGMGSMCKTHRSWSSSLKMEAVIYFETLVSTYQTMQCHNLEVNKITAVKTSDLVSLLKLDHILTVKERSLNCRISGPRTQAIIFDDDEFTSYDVTSTN
jgi:hypothetical protein